MDLDELIKRLQRYKTEYGNIKILRNGVFSLIPVTSLNIEIVKKDDIFDYYYIDDSDFYGETALIID